MKKIFKSTLLLLCGVALFTACADDNDSNPTLQSPTTFKLNTPAYAAMSTDLATSSSLAFTWSQPDYGFPVAAQYQLQVSLDGNYTISVEEAEADETGTTKANYATIDATFTEAKGSIDAADVAKAMQQIAQWEPNQVPATQTLYVRATSTLVGSTIYSNTVQLKTIPYYIELSNAPVEIWYLLGSDIADGSWGSDIGKAVIPMQPIEGEEYDSKTGQGKIQWIGYLAGNGFKLRGSMTDNWATQWGQGDSFGTFVKNDGGSGNITVPEAGVYTVTLDTKGDKLTIEKYDGTPTVFSGMAISGSFNEWGDTDMTPCNTAAENHDWYIVQHLDAGTEIKIKQAGSWDFNKGGELVADGNDLYAFGVNGGANLYIEETADYLILFNDITGFIRFIKQ